MATSAAAHLFVGAKTDVGAVRSRNEDPILCEPTSSPEALAHGWLGIVADGLGGHRSGNIASQLAADTTRAVFYTRAREKRARDRLRVAVQNANEVILKNGRSAADNA